MYADESLMDSGEILEIVVPNRLVMSWRSEWKPEFKAKGYSICSLEIEPVGSSAKLTLTHAMKERNSICIAAVSDG